MHELNINCDACGHTHKECTTCGNLIDEGSHWTKECFCDHRSEAQRCSDAAASRQYRSIMPGPDSMGPESSWRDGDRMMDSYENS